MNMRGLGSPVDSLLSSCLLLYDIVSYLMFDISHQIMQVATGAGPCSVLGQINTWSQWRLRSDNLTIFRIIMGISHQLETTLDFSNFDIDIH